MAAMEGWRDPELQALRPDRVIIIFAIEPDHVVPNRNAGGLALHLAGRFDRPVHQAPEHRDLVAELLDGIVKLLDRLLGGVHGDDRGRGHAVAEIAEIFGRHDIVGPTGGTARLAVADPRHAQPTGRIDDREIEPNLVEAFVQEPREYRGREIAGVLRRMSPERLLADPPPATLLDRHRQDAARAAPTAFQPRTAASPPTLRSCSVKTGPYSIQCPSASMTGWSRRDLIWAGVKWALTSTSSADGAAAPLLIEPKR